MVLVDTSVFIPFLKDQDTPETRALDRIIEDRIPFGISPYTYQELLQGVKTPAEFSLLKAYLETQRIYDLMQGLDSFAAAARMFFDCQKAGLTIRRGADLFIAQTAIENKLSLLHSDRDFIHLASIQKNLKCIEC